MTDRAIAKLRLIGVKELTFWRDFRAGGRRDRAGRKHAMSYKQRRGTYAHSSWPVEAVRPAPSLRGAPYVVEQDIGGKRIRTTINHAEGVMTREVL